MSLENNISNNNEPLSSLPLHLRDHRIIRSHSINRIPESSRYMKESFLFDKIKQSHFKDDNTLEKDYSPLVDNRPFMPRILKINAADFENLSSSSVSSQSSMHSFNDAASASSLELSFDGSGNPYLKPFRASAFAKVQNKDVSDRSSSVSQDGQSRSDSESREKRMPPLPDSFSNVKADMRFQNKSSFFRLKNENDSYENPYDPH